MDTEQCLSLDDLGESWASALLLELPPGQFYVVGVGQYLDREREHVEYVECDDLESAQATARKLRTGHQVAIWQRVE